MKTKASLIVIFLFISGIVLSCQGFSFKGLAGSSGFGGQAPDRDTYGQTEPASAQRTASQDAGTVTTGAVRVEITPEVEYQIGREAAEKLLGSYRVWNGNAKLSEYLNRICMSIAIKSPHPDIFNGYYVSILDSNEINSFAVPGGHIFLTRGLINIAKSEDALASMIAHEAAHLQLRHAMSSNKSADEIVQTLTVNGYSLVQEFEADNSAMALLAGAGYNPSEFIEMLQTLPSPGDPGFSETHPSPALRITNARRMAANHRTAASLQTTRDVRIERFNEATR